MLDYLEKFNNLPIKLKEKLSSSDALDMLENIEKEYGVDLATTVIRVAVKDIAWGNLPSYIANEFSLNKLVAEGLVEELDSKLFAPIADELGLGIPKKEAKTNDGNEWLDRRRAEAKPDTSSFYFSPDDESDIKVIKKTSDAVKTGQKQHSDIDEKLNLIVARISLQFSSLELLERFRNILKTYLIGVRSKIDTKETLKKAVAHGGLDLDDLSVDQIFATADRMIADEENRDIKKPPKFKVAEDSRADEQEKIIGRDLPYDFSKLVAGEDGQLDQPEEITEALDDAPGGKDLPAESGQEIAEKEGEKEIAGAPDTAQDGGEKDFPPALDLRQVLAEAGEEDQAEIPEIQEEEKEAEIEEPPRASQPEKITGRGAEEEEDLVFHSSVADDVRKISAKKPKQVSQLRPRHENGKVKMDDIKYEPKLVGPIEELETMDLLNFRRLGDDPKERTEKILGKLETLEEENYKKRLEGVAAWRKSPVNQLYLKMGESSIGQGGVAKAFNQQVDEKEMLTLDEFKAIMDFNKKIRF